jgi:hypothetical protein
LGLHKVGTWNGCASCDPAIGSENASCCLCPCPCLGIGHLVGLARQGLCICPCLAWGWEGGSALQMPPIEVLQARERDLGRGGHGTRFWYSASFCHPSPRQARRVGQ